ncbi:MAG: bifunctional 3,4-dihydroxy-2-butanone-4-phosphate synthase/GTP cyclohydrolase II [bacterium]|nr:bifunctional 3,4-dihydroxy-2-butanone-4-phosphate synthase/GTP cyclohydrolase II [bacterium]
MSSHSAQLDTIEDAIRDIAAGKMVVVVDDEDRENEGDLVMAAEKVTPEAVNFMAKFGRGLICLPLTAGRVRALRLPLMVGPPGDQMATAFTVSVDARGTKTGISAHERALTIRTAADPHSRPDDLLQPGHVFPLRARDGGVLRRPGHTEAAVDMARLAGLHPAGVICEIMNEDGTMARLSDLLVFARSHALRIVTIADLVKYRLQREKLVRRLARASLPTPWGVFVLHAYEDCLTGVHHLALVLGDISDRGVPLVRVHSECLTGEVFRSLRCDCGHQLDLALKAIGNAGAGVLLYMRQEGRGIGLANKVRAYELQDAGMDTVEANQALGFPPDARDYGIGAQILADLGIHRLRLLTNNPRKFQGLSGYGLEIVDRVPLQVTPGEFNHRYLETKRTKLGHILHGGDGDAQNVGG